MMVRFNIGDHIQAPELNAIIKRDGLIYLSTPSAQFGILCAQIRDGSIVYHTEQRFMSNDIVITKVEAYG